MAAPWTGAVAEPLELSLGVASATVLRGIAVGDSGVHGQVAVRYADEAGWRLAAGAAAVHSEGASSGWEAQSVLRAGFARRLGDDSSLQVALARYDYPRSGRLRRYAQDELGATWAHRDLVYLSVAALHRPRVEGAEARRRVAFDLVAQHAVPAGLTASAAIGFVQGRGSDADYTYGHLGLAARWGAAQAQLLFVGTDAARRFGAVAASRWVASLQWDL